MMLIDTTVLVDVLRDASGENADRPLMLIGPDEEMAFTRFTELEVLQGARDKRDGDRIATVIGRRKLLAPSNTKWAAAARIYFDLRRDGTTIRSIVDCCIAHVAIEHQVMLVHNDKDFEQIAKIAPLAQTRLKLRSTRITKSTP